MGVTGVWWICCRMCGCLTGSLGGQVSCAGRCWQAMLPAVALAGLAGPLQLNNIISGQPPSQITKCQGTLFGFLCGSVSCLYLWFHGSTLSHPHLQAPPLLAAKWVCVCPCLGVTHTFMTAPHVVAHRLCAFLLVAISRLHIWLCLAVLCCLHTCPLVAVHWCISHLCPS